MIKRTKRGHEKIARGRKTRVVMPHARVCYYHPATMIALKKSGLAWAKAEMLKHSGTAYSRGWTKAEVEHHILCELGRRWNIGVQSYVRKTLKLEMIDYFPEAKDEAEDE